MILTTTLYWTLVIVLFTVIYLWIYEYAIINALILCVLCISYTPTFFSFDDVRLIKWLLIDWLIEFSAWFVILLCIYCSTDQQFTYHITWRQTTNLCSWSIAIVIVIVGKRNNQVSYVTSILPSLYRIFRQLLIDIYDVQLFVS